HPVALWTAYVAAAAAGVVYVALLAVLWLFSDLMVSRGRLPTFHDAVPAAQDRFLQEWLPPAEPSAAPALKEALRPAAPPAAGPAGGRSGGGAARGRRRPCPGAADRRRRGAGGALRTGRAGPRAEHSGGPSDGVRASRPRDR